MNAVAVVAGLAVVVAMLVDVFHSVVVPRPSPRMRTIRLSPYLVRAAWPLWRAWGSRATREERRERRLASFGPLGVFVLLVVWLLGLLVGFSLALWGLRAGIHPHPTHIGPVVYLAATALLTIGFGDVVATDTAGRAIVLAAGASGLILVAVVISFLFTLYSAFERREIAVVRLDARAGAPPSGVALLEELARLDLLGDLPRLFDEWETWSAQVLESHLAYPLLAWFRSSHRGESWQSALGAVLDAASLCSSTIADAPIGAATMLHRTGTHLVLDLTGYLAIAGVDGPGVERFEFDAACERLAAAGFGLRDADEAWTAFARLRTRYAGPLNAMARYWETPPAEWIGDRSPVARSVPDRF